jgi:hypothetical protein
MASKSTLILIQKQKLFDIEAYCWNKSRTF